MMNLLPQEIKDALTGRVSQILHRLHRELQSVEGLLRGQVKGYEMTDRLCMGCGRRLPATAKKCHPCYNESLQQEHCTNQTRIAEYFAVLGRSELWPSVAPFQKCTISELANRFARAKDDRQHQCDAGLDCPLQNELERLSEKVDRIIENIKGVPLDFDGR